MVLNISQGGIENATQSIPDAVNQTEVYGNETLGGNFTEGNDTLDEETGGILAITPGVVSNGWNSSGNSNGTDSESNVWPNTTAVATEIPESSSGVR